MFRGAVQGLRGERLNIFADMAIDSCTGRVYLSDGGRFYPVGNVAKLSFVGAQPGGTLYLELNGLVYALGIPEAAAGQQLLLEASDPSGDDFGTGRYQYPKNPVFKPGVFDLLGFAVYDLGDRLRFVFRVRELGGNPWGGPAGFSLQFFHVYINRGAGARNDTLGLRVALCREAAWDVALLIGPGWTGGNRIVYSDGSSIDDAMAIRAGPNSTIIADVPKRYVGDFDRSWRLTVFLTSWDGYGPDNIRNFGVMADEWTVGGADPVAVLAGVAPRVFDLLAPTAEAQTKALTTYQVSRLPNGTYVGKPASVCLYASAEKSPQIQTITVTAAVTYTTAIRETVTITTTTPVATTYQVTTTVKETATNWTVTVAVAAIALIAGLAAGILARRR
jgi:pullulanase (EC 3.2.1.41)/alpha-amylase (EC:3.2.1.1)